MPKYRRSFLFRAADVRRILDRHELSQGDLAELCSVTRRTVARWVRNGARVDASLRYIRNSPFSMLERLSKSDSAKNGSLKSRIRRDRESAFTPVSRKMSQGR